MIPEHSIKAGGGILITYPPQVTPSRKIPISVNITVAGYTIDPNEIYVAPDQSARAIFIANIIQGVDFEPTEDGMIIVEVSGLRNPLTNERTDSFEL